MLLSHGELETLFHEFGHALHSLLSRTEFQHLSGTRGAADFVEVPSILFERFAWDERVLRLFARHHATGAPLPARVGASLRAARAACAATETLTQIVHARLDQELFGAGAASAGGGRGDDTTEALARIQREVMPWVPHAPGTHWHARFGHLTGYGASYYGYLWDRVIAAQLWRALFAADPLDRGAGTRLWRELLAHGSAADPHAALAALVDDCGGDPLCPSAFLAEIGEDGDDDWRD